MGVCFTSCLGKIRKVRDAKQELNLLDLNNLVLKVHVLYDALRIEQNLITNSLGKNNKTYMAAMVLKSKKKKSQNFFVCFYNPLSPIYSTHV